MPTLADVFRLYGPAYLEKYRDKMSVDQFRAMRAILHCRTPELGTTVYRCKSCERLHAVHRPCGNRHCPNCQGNKAREWKRKALAQLLPCSYFMVTFTVPEALRAFIRSHSKECLSSPLGFQYRFLGQTSQGSEIRRLRADRSDGRAAYLGTGPLLEPSCSCAGARRSYLEGPEAVAAESK